jgi:hypothetical protein
MFVARAYSTATPRDVLDLIDFVAAHDLVANVDAILRDPSTPPGRAPARPARPTTPNGFAPITGAEDSHSVGDLLHRLVTQRIDCCRTLHHAGGYRTVKQTAVSTDA